jgi:hypothetical protein
MIPVEHSGDGKVVVFDAGIRNVSNERVDIVAISNKPSGIDITDDSGGIDEISIMKVVIIIVSTTKVNSRVSGDI